MADHGHSPVREGILAGLLSATVIAIWLLVVDAIAGNMMRTPRVLGQGLLGVLGMRMGDNAMGYILTYTIFHYVAFCLVGIIVAAIVHQARRTPAILAGFFILFIAFELGFYALAGGLSAQTELGGLAWYQIMVANLVAAAVMIGFMWVRHPEIKRELTEAFEGNDA